MDAAIIFGLIGIGLAAGAVISDTLIDRVLDSLGVYERFGI